MSRPIDVLHLGRDRVICAYEVDGVIVDPGPASCVDTLIDRLGPVEPRALLLTHIHLDHAGATGVLCRRYPKLKVYVHERGAPHLIDPSKLLASAGRLYGDDMWELWGEVAPVPEERITALSGGETVEGFRVAYTPGPRDPPRLATCTRTRATPTWATWPACASRPTTTRSRPRRRPTSTSRRGSTRSTRSPSWNPQSLCLTHFGQVTEVAEHLHRMRCALVDSAERARMKARRRFIARLEEELVDATDPATVEAFEQAAPPNQLYMGLERYWRKKAE